MHIAGKNTRTTIIYNIFQILQVKRYFERTIHAVEIIA